MRYALIDTANRRVFETHTPCEIANLLPNLLRCDVPIPVRLAADLDLWITDEPRRDGFRFFGEDPFYAGSAVLVGRSRLGDIKSLPRHYCLEIIKHWVWFGQRELSFERRQTRLIPMGALPATRLAVNDSDMPYIMQMYG